MAESNSDFIGMAESNSDFMLIEDALDTVYGFARERFEDAERETVDENQERKLGLALDTVHDYLVNQVFGKQ